MISNHGRVYSLISKKFMKPEVDKDGYLRIQLTTTEIKKDGTRRRTHVGVHRLVTWEFIGPPPDELTNVVNHKDGVTWRNYAHNLEWTSVLGNTNHAKENGLMNNSGTSAKACKYDEEKIRNICKMFEEGYDNKEVFEKITGHRNFKSDYATYSLVNKLYRKICYWDIVKDYDYEPDKEFYKCDDETQWIRDMILANKTNYEILYDFGYEEPSDDKRFYNKIIQERAKCKAIAQRLEKARQPQ